MQNILLECARRDLSNGGVYGVAWVPWHGAQQIFARPSPTSWAQRGQISALGRSNSLAGATRCTPATPDHFATISSGCGGARARSAVVTSSALLELPPGELSASLTAVTRLCTLARASLVKWAQLPHKKGRGGVRGGPPEAAQKLTSAQRRMRASEGSFMGSDGAGRPSGRPQQGV